MVQLQWMPRGTPQKAIKVKAAKVCALVLPIFMHLTLRRFRARRNLRRRLDRLAALVARDANKDRDRAAAIQEIDGLPDYIFRRMFRMTRPTFNALLKKINEHYPESSSEDFIKNCGRRCCRNRCTLERARPKHHRERLILLDFARYKRLSISHYA